MFLRIEILLLFWSLSNHYHYITPMLNICVYILLLQIQSNLFVVYATITRMKKKVKINIQPNISFNNY